MPPTSDTLNIGQLGSQHGHDQSEPYSDAAEAARRRIAELPDPHKPIVLEEPHVVTDKHELAAQLTQTQTKKQAPRKKRLVPSRLRPVLAAVATFAILLTLFKAPVLISQLGYHAGSGAPINVPATTAAISSANTITIPKINVYAPVIYDNTRSEAQVLDDLENGVIHYAGTALPGQAGNTVIFGHSSNDWWEPGNYKYIFVLLDKLQVGDQFYVDYQSTRYIYQVTGTQVVDPTDVSVLNATATPTITLITCTPPGTSWKRLVVTANQISPNPLDATKSTATDQRTVNQLPSTEGGGGIWNDIKSTVGGVVNSISSIFGGSSNTNNTNQLPAIQ